MTQIPRWVVIYSTFVLVFVLFTFLYQKINGVSYEYEWYRSEAEKLERSTNQISGYDQMLVKVAREESDPDIIGRFTFNIGYSSETNIQAIEYLIVLLIFLLPILVLLKQKANFSLWSLFFVCSVLGLLSFGARIMYWYGYQTEWHFVEASFFYGICLSGLIIELLVLYVVRRMSFK